jgi:integrase
VRDLWKGYETDKAGLAVIATMKHTFKAIEPQFGTIPGDMVTIADCRAHTQARRKAKIKDGTIHTELGHLRMVLVWAEKHKLIDKAPEIERPAKPLPRDRYLTKPEAKRLIRNAKAPHVALAIHLMLATAARVTAVLELTWDRVDFKQGLIHLRDPSDLTRRKGRAVVPINATLLAELKKAKECARSKYVVEWAGEQVKSLKRGIATAAQAAGLGFVTPHVFRHTAAVWMAQGGTPMSEIAQYLGHNSTRMTEKVYARYSPDHLRGAAAQLELDDDIVPTGTTEPDDENNE